MNKKLVPTFIAKSIYTLDFNKFNELNIKYLFIDLDNTLASPYAKDANQDVEIIINKLKSYNVTPIIISNNTKERVSRFVRNLDVMYMHSTKKPGIKRIKKFIEENNFDLNTICGIGDQSMTDVLMYKRLGCKVILVEPLVKQDLPITWIPRFLDKCIRKVILKKKLSKEF